MLDLDSIGRRKPNASAEDWLVKDVSLKLTPGDRLAITGPSGAGKTVLLRLIALLEEPDAGECRWEGRTVSDAQVPAYRRDVIYLHQRPHFVDGTVRENLNLPFQFLANKGLQYSEATVGETLDRIQRPRDLLNRNVQALSGGETQLVALLRALQLQPRVLLLDEPTASADEQLASAIEQLVMQWCQNGQAMLFVSHKLDQIERLSNRRLGLEQGRAA